MLERFLSQTAASVDRALFHALSTATKGGLRGTSAERLDHAERVRGLRAIAGMYSTPEIISDVERFFPGPAREVQERLVRREDDSDVVELSWASRAPLFHDAVAERYLKHRHNQTGVARLYTPGGAGRPAVVLIHGYLGGNWLLESRVWPLQWLMRLGLDPVLTVLPFHGARATPGRLGPPPFPSTDPRFTIEAFRQAVADLRTLAHTLRQRGAPAVGLMGMSLGGYTTALAATVDEYDFVVPMIPLGSIADFALAGGRLGSTPDEAAEQHRLLDAAHAVVSPFARPSRVKPGRALVLTGAADRITPSHHASRLADHLGAQLHTFHGGHLLQFGRGNAFRAVGTMLRRLGLASG
ncbi:MAG: hypothetical protein AB2A00_05580 [Myxococcota bacterium]